MLAGYYHVSTKSLILSLCPSFSLPPAQGVGYGLLLALYSNDQEYFSLQLDSAEKHMWNYRQYVLPPSLPPSLAFPFTSLPSHSHVASILHGRDAAVAKGQTRASCLRLIPPFPPPSLSPSLPLSLPATTTGE